VGCLRIDDQPLQFLPVQLLLREAGLFLFLGLLVLKEEDADEEVQEEERADQNEDNEEAALGWTFLILGAVVALGDVDGLVHDVGPTFQRGYNEERLHGLANVVKVGVEAEPFTAGVFARPLRSVLIHLLRTVEEHSHVGVHSVDGEHEPDNHDDDGHIDDRADRLEKGGDDHLELRVVRDDSQRSDHSKHSQHFQGWDFGAGEEHVDDGGGYDEEIELVPGVRHVTASIHGEAESDDLQDTLDDEEVVEDEVQFLRNLDDLGRFGLVDDVRFCGQFGRGEGDQQHDKTLEVAMFLDVVAVATETATAVEQVN